MLTREIHERQEEGCGHARDSEETTYILALLNAPCQTLAELGVYGRSRNLRRVSGHEAVLGVQQIGCKACFWLWVIATHWNLGSSTT